MFGQDITASGQIIILGDPIKPSPPISTPVCAHRMRWPDEAFASARPHNNAIQRHPDAFRCLKTGNRCSLQSPLAQHRAPAHHPAPTCHLNLATLYPLVSSIFCSFLVSITCTACLRVLAVVALVVFLGDVGLLASAWALHLRHSSVTQRPGGNFVDPSAFFSFNLDIAHLRSCVK